MGTKPKLKPTIKKFTGHLLCVTRNHRRHVETRGIRREKDKSPDRCLGKDIQLRTVKMTSYFPLHPVLRQSLFNKCCRSKARLLHASSVVLRKWTPDEIAKVEEQERKMR